MKKISHGGSRKKSGRKQLSNSDKKQQVNLFIEGWLIDKHGSKEIVKEKCYKFLKRL